MSVLETRILSGAQPAPAQVPALINSELCARYHQARGAGDFYDFALVGPHLLLLMMDIAGRRAETMAIAADVQQQFRERAAELFALDDINEAEAISQLARDLNREVIRAAGGVRSAPAFLCCYNETIGTMTYINAGHMPPLVRNGNEVSLLEPSGIPFGLFSHATYEANFSILQSGDAALVVSRGLIELRAPRDQFGLERLPRIMLSHTSSSARELCETVLARARRFMERKRNLRFPGLSRQPVQDQTDLGPDDVTIIVLWRKPIEP
jgi:serine phosphatase RsbU (regulator of sigma subunit)